MPKFGIPAFSANIEGVYRVTDYENSSTALMSDLLNYLATYVPWLMARRFANDPTPPAAPQADDFRAAVLFVDISGFTRLAQKLAEEGTGGAEKLTRILNDYFGQLINIITLHGGDVVKFAGDGLQAVWSTIATGEDLEIVTLRAAHCGLTVQKQLQNYQPTDGTRLSLRIGIGAGDVIAGNVGGVLKRWEFLLAGQPIGQMNEASELALPGQVVLSNEAWWLIEEQCRGEAVGPSGYILQEIPKPLPPRALPSTKLAPGSENALRSFVPAAITQRLQAGQVNFLAENRRVSVLFLQVNGLDESQQRDVANLQAVMQSLQNTLYRFEGSVRQFIVDDKGMVFIASFGLPPITHEDDPARAVQAAIALQETLQLRNLNSAVGVATGSIFCGPVGNDVRREYMMVGDIVYLSARLMSAANGGVLVDEATYQNARQRFSFDQLPALRVKNRPLPVQVFAPKSTDPLDPNQRPLVGRAKEQAIIHERLEALRQGENGVILIEGAAGIGKTRLVLDLIRQAKSLDIEVLSGDGDAVDRATPYHGWRGVFAQMFKMESFTQTRSQGMKIMARLARDPDLLAMSPLLSAVLPMDLPENEATLLMSGQSRADNTRDFLVRLLRFAADESPKVIVLENGHWLDSASWALAAAVHELVSPMLLVIAMRPLTELPVEVRQLIEGENTRYLNLGGLSAMDTTTLINQRLSVSQVPEAVAQLIQEKSDGNPFFAEQLAYTLRDSGLLDTAGGHAVLKGGVEDLRRLDVPDTVQGVITSRIDRLPPAQQLTLKVASVIGTTFPVRAVFDVYPIASDRGKLSDHLAELVRLELIEQTTPEPDISYSFKHTTTQDVAYNLMLQTQRRDLHEAVARWYERNFVYDLSPFYGMLSHHWESAGDIDRAVDYLSRAGEQALRGGANSEAANFFIKAIELDGKAAIQSNALRRARWERQAGEALWELGQLRESSLHTDRALDLLGRPRPTSTTGLRLGILRQISIQALHRLFPKRYMGRAEDDIQVQEAARAYRQEQEVAYFGQEILRAFYAGFYALNLAEQLGPRYPELSWVYANATFGMGIVRLHGQARYYRARALETAERVNSPTVKSIVALRTGIYGNGIGQWDEAQAAFQRCIQLANNMGDFRYWGDGINALGMNAYLQGQYQRSYESYAQLGKAVENTDNIEHQAWALNGQAMNLLRQGQTDEAITLLQAAHKILMHDADRAALILNHGLLAIAALRHEDMTLARQEADVTAMLLTQSLPFLYALLDSYAAVAEVYLAGWQQAVQSTTQSHRERRAMQKRARRALNDFKRYARTFPIGQSRYLLLRGRYQWQAGKQEKAVASWQASLSTAESLKMSYDTALAHLELALYLPNDVERVEHLDKAAEQFQALGAEYELRQVNRSKGAIPPSQN